MWKPYFTTDKITLENVQRCVAQYVKVVYTYDASVTQMLNELKWLSLESQRNELCYTQTTYLLPEYIPEFYQQISQYQLQTRLCHMFRLTGSFCNTDTYNKYSFIPATSRQWNLLPHHIVVKYSKYMNYNSSFLILQTILSKPHMPCTITT